MPFVTTGNRHGRAFPQVPSDSRPLRHATRRRRASSTIDEFVADERGKFSAAQSFENSENAKDSRYGRASFAALVAPSRAARKWRRNGLKRLNPRPRMVWSPKPRSHNIWYMGAWLTVRSGELISEPRLRPSGHGSRIRSAGRPMGNFSPRNPLESLKTGKESRRRLRLSGHGLRIRRARRPREKTCRKRVRGAKVEANVGLALGCWCGG